MIILKTLFVSILFLIYSSCKNGTTRDETHALLSEIKSVGWLNAGRDPIQRTITLRTRSLSTKKKHFLVKWNHPRRNSYTPERNQGCWAEPNQPYMHFGRTEPLNVWMIFMKLIIENINVWQPYYAHPNIGRNFIYIALKH